MPAKLARVFPALLIAGLAVPAYADPYVFGQQPQQDQTPPEQHDCVVHNSDFTPNATYEIELTNTCEQRYRCTLRSYIVNAAGPTKDEAVLTLEPASAGPASRKVHVIHLKEGYGEAHESRSCAPM